MRRFLKHLALAMAVLALLGGLVGIWIWQATREPERVAQAFLAAWAAGDTDAALALATPGFRAETGGPELAAAARSLHLDASTQVDWYNVGISGGASTADAALVHAPDMKLPLRLLLRRHEGDWRVNAVVPPRAGLTIAPGDGWPDEAELVRRSSVLILTLANEARSANFAGTYALLATDFQQDYTLPEFNAAFAGFSNPELDLTVLERFPPEFDELSLDDFDHVLWVRGRFRTQPRQIAFRIGWVQQGLSVRPMALTLESVQP